MPELPEVETARREIEHALKGKRIVKVVIKKDEIVFDRDSVARVRAALTGAKVIGTDRRGKYLWLKLDRKPWIVFHLGMTGHLRFYGKNAPTQSPRKNGHGVTLEKKPRFVKIELHTADGSIAMMTDPRRFGRIRLSQDPLGEPPISQLGFDPLFDFPTAAKLHEILSRSKAPIKAVLLDQSVFAGVGNWIADEVLFQARLAPARASKSLSLSEVKRLRTSLLYIIRYAVRARADYRKFPDDWLFHRRWGKAKDAATLHGERIVHQTIGGRTTAWVPAVQK
jgi:formamidopyrimidine-DNA glycosylase